MREGDAFDPFFFFRFLRSLLSLRHFTFDALGCDSYVTFSLTTLFSLSLSWVSLRFDDLLRSLTRRIHLRPFSCFFFFVCFLFCCR